ncbi:hypothetical protein M441DRAFT_264686 [Trichoderma asperellum CBS 433.97]|uniref:Uncharacterized protein n=1 Tax=Trichoderma asperellum (strain ATCC 204424 / CBS 433.97 / NBRC 101777) TaxID=1042311 RepID=A0A2T3YXI6_TRIA4|nr:hypothetical protein M441DRAFT_264686 [Trichoderma asperellum CBS 433.97]PTB37269.1 hypothetical protein M441DRAFT_264686 [Trichoderma asperellum CBS 433.97]
MGASHSMKAQKKPVNTRAWCLEERVLSARALWYCSHTLQYQCQMGHRNFSSNQNMADGQDGFPRLPDRIFTPKLSSLPQISVKESRKRGSKAHPCDRLNALSGIAGYFAEFWSNNRYLAGLWEHQLPCCLL